MNFKATSGGYPILLTLYCLFMCLSINGQTLDFSGAPDCSKIKFNDVLLEEDMSLNKPLHQYFLDEEIILFLYCQAKAEGNEYQEALNLFRLGNKNEENPNSLSRSSKDLAYLQASIALSKSKGYTDIQLKANSKICSIFTSNRMYSQARDYANLFLSICKEHKIKEYLPEGYMILGRIFREENKIDQADSLLNLALASITPETSAETQGFIFLHLSYLNSIKQNFEKSFAFANEGLKIIEESKNNFLRSNMHRWFNEEILRYYINKKQFDKAYDKLSYFKLNEGTGRNEKEYLIYLALIQQAQGKGEQAIENYLKAANIAQKNGDYQDVIDITILVFPLLIEYDGISKEFAKTYSSALLAAESISNKNNINSLFRKINFDLEEERLKYFTLKDQLEYSSKITFLTVGTSLLSVISCLLLWLSYHNKKVSILHVEQLNKKLSLTNSKLTESNQSLENFALVAAHEFKKPITSISERISSLKSATLKGEKSNIDTSLNEIISKLIGLNEVIDELLNSTKKTDNTPIPMNISLNSIILNIKRSIENYEQHENVEFIVTKNFPMVLGHSSLINRLILNVLNSSAELFKNKEKTILELDWKSKENNIIEVVIKNRDIFLSEAEVKYAFNSLKEEIPSTRIANTGLGLITSRKLVEIYKGKMWFENTSENGSSLHFTLPASRLVKISA